MFVCGDDDTIFWRAATVSGSALGVLLSAGAPAAHASADYLLGYVQQCMCGVGRAPRACSVYPVVPIAS